MEPAFPIPTLDYGVITPYVALCLAVHMGARRIGLIGVDFTDNHFFGKTGSHEWTPHLATIEAQFSKLQSALLARGIHAFNLSPSSRVTAFPKMALDVFAAMPPVEGKESPARSTLRIVSYATTPVAGVPALGFECLVVPGVDVAHRFRGVHPYPVSWESVIYNKLRLASIHFSPFRKDRVVERLKANAAYPSVAERLAGSDALVRSHRLRSMRRYDDSWFFARFHAELTPELADVSPQVE